MVTACQVKLKTDDRLGVLIPCGRPDAALARVACSREGHTENVVMCRRCTKAITWCEQCLAQDGLLVRASVLILAG